MPDFATAFRAYLTDFPLTFTKITDKNLTFPENGLTHSLLFAYFPVTIRASN